MFTAKSKGGSDQLKNLNAMCVDCNSNKSDRFSSEKEARKNGTDADTLGGYLIDDINEFKKTMPLPQYKYFLDKLPDVPDGLFGASKKRSWKK